MMKIRSQTSQINNIGRDDIFPKVLGNDKVDRVHMYGFDITPYVTIDLIFMYDEPKEPEDEKDEELKIENISIKATCVYLRIRIQGFTLAASSLWRRLPRFSGKFLPFMFVSPLWFCELSLVVLDCAEFFHFQLCRMAVNQVRLNDPYFLNGKIASRSFTEALSGTFPIAFSDMNTMTNHGMSSLWISEEKILALAGPFKYSFIVNVKHRRNDPK
ncbi:hypothetical protein M5K25_016254 [Dendrobium thyrsiflorum]|uniref:Uncharacterized protein n=1 Tax=Dendrobium thyrsiflorum TaxID=117978 RepID=A0ABD0UJ92_DENTH